MQREILTEKSIFGKSGAVQAAGWCRQPLLIFDKSMCKSRIGLYERDSYFIQNNDMAILLSVTDNGFGCEVGAMVADFSTGITDARTLKKYMTFGKLDMPSSSKNGDVTFTDMRVGMNFSNTAINRYIRCEYVDFSKDKTLYVNLELKRQIEESFNVLIPVRKNNRNFYLKRFLPAMSASGVIRCGGAEYSISADNSFAFLDWQRSYISDKSCYHALYCDSTIDGRQFALSLAGGIGDTSFSTENCFFSDGVIHKFASVKAEGDDEKPDEPWHFTAGTAMDITFKPTVKCGRLMSAKLGHRTVILGKLYGTIKQIDTDKLILDALPAHLEFAEV